jgi:two-component system, LuxR family, response regulator FixJ
MELRKTIALIDSDHRRRAAVSHLLADTELHVEPFEDLVELASRWPRSKLVLACDEGSQVLDLTAYMVKIGRWMTVVAYAPEPSTPRIVQAVLAGALDYLI